jgi:hypothetical protein
VLYHCVKHPLALGLSHTLLHLAGVLYLRP